jgi:hypothetical protein
MMILRAAVVAFALACTGCVDLSTKPARAPVMCNFGGQMVETQLFFGLSKPKGGVVSGGEWSAFVRREVTPRFPEGFSVFDGAGFWLDGGSKRTITEKSKTIVRIHADTAQAGQAILAVIGSYKKQFAQEAVLRVDRPVCAQF